VSDAAARHHRLLLRPEEAAQALSISRTTLYGLLQSNAIRSVKVGGLRRIPVEALEDFVTELSSDTGADTGARCIEGTGVAGTATRRGGAAPEWLAGTPIRTDPTNNHVPGRFQKGSTVRQTWVATR
jgi:excisionase family DNA binding protein